MTGEQVCATETDENDGIPSKRYQFRLKLPQALEVDEIIKNEFGGNVTQFFKSLLRDRAILAKHRRERAAETAALIQRYSLTPRDLTEAGLAWSEWTSVKRGD